MDQHLRRSNRNKSKTGVSKALETEPNNGKCTDSVAVGEPKTKTPKLSKATAMREYRARIKKDPLRNALEVEKNKEKCLKYRQNMTEEQKMKEKENAKLRMRIYRANKKENGPKRSTRLDAQAQEEQRAKWRQEYKKKCDAMSSQKKRRINERRRQRYAERKAIEAERMIQGGGGSDVNARTPSGTVEKVLKILPKEPSEYVSTVRELAKVASPRKRRLFQETEADTPEGQIGQSVLQSLNSLKGSNRKDDRAVRKSLLQAILPKSMNIRETSRRTGLNRKTITKVISLKRTSNSKNKFKSVTDFYEQKARICPDKKAVSKKTGMFSRVLSSSLKDLHQEYTLESKGSTKIGFSTFAKCRPQYVKLMAKNKMRACLCEYCQNVDLKLQAVNKILPGNRWLSSCKAAIDVTVCDQPTVDCHYRRCQNCGTHLMKEWYECLHIQEEPLSWHRWEYKTATFNGKQVNRKVLATKTASSDVFLDELCKEVAFLSEHLFRAKWQSKQFQESTKNVKDGQLVMVLDFAENYTCFHQDEVQSAHWHHDQVTIHPVVCYYRCDACHEIMTESVVAVSDDMTHDHHAVRAIVTASLHHLRTERGLKVDHMVQWTDGCASQYKSKGPFYDLAQSQTAFQCKTERHFFGSRHGKGPSDGESAVVKQFASRAVTAGHGIVSNAREFFNLCQSSKLVIKGTNGCTHFQRNFIWIDSKLTDRTKRLSKTLKGTRQFHSLFTNKTGKLFSRHLTCSCTGCTRNEVCINVDTVGPWTLHEFADAAELMDDDGDVSQTAAPSTAHDEYDTTQVNPQYHVNECIVVRYPDRCYPGVIQEVLDQELRVKFLQPHAKDQQKFVYPTVEDIQIVDPSTVVTKISLIPRGSSFREWTVPEFSDWL